MKVRGPHLALLVFVKGPYKYTLPHACAHAEQKDAFSMLLHGIFEPVSQVHGTFEIPEADVFQKLSYLRLNQGIFNGGTF